MDKFKKKEGLFHVRTHFDKHIFVFGDPVRARAAPSSYCLFSCPYEVNTWKNNGILALV